MIDNDDVDDDLPIQIVHNCQWHNAADNDDPFISENFLCYRFEGTTEEEVVVLVDLSDPFAATIVNPDHGIDLGGLVLEYLRKRFEHVKQTTRNGFTVLWDSWQ